LVRGFYEPHMERLYDHAHARAADLVELEALAAGHPSRERFLSDLVLDPPEGTATEAGPPHLDEDYLILSTIHSAKGQEWEAVTILHVTDGCIPSDMAARSPEELEEERRLLYVAMTRARSLLTLVHPLRFHVRQQARWGDRHVWAQRSRFLTEEVLQHFVRETPPRRGLDAEREEGAGAGVDVGARLRDMWS
jgi:DNA helicase-2/ATP-dependent DNA helicase PcrA